MTARSFQFDSVFHIRDDEGGPAPAPKKTRFTLEEVEAERRGAFLEGQQSAEAEAQRLLADAMNQVAGGLQHILQRLDADLLSYKAEASALALQIGQKIAGRALDSYPHGQIENVIADCLNLARSEAFAEISAAPEVMEAMGEDIERIAAQSGFEGRVNLVADPNCRGAQCHIRWPNGDARLDPGALAQEIADIVEQGLTGEASGEAAPTPHGEG